jgi:hypothetical protein
MIKTCSKCKVEITKEVECYSEKNYGKSLCIDCQPNKKKAYYYNPKNHELENGYPIKKNKKERFLHRWMAEQKILKRKLEKGEEVHHVDGDKLSFDPKNLAVMSKDSHNKIEKRLIKERNLNKINTLVFLLAFFIFVLTQGPYDFYEWIIVSLLGIGVIISSQSNFFSWVVKKTKLYKIMKDAS